MSWGWRGELPLYAKGLSESCVTARQDGHPGMEDKGSPITPECPLCTSQPHLGHPCHRQTPLPTPRNPGLIFASFFKFKISLPADARAAPVAPRSKKAAEWINGLKWLTQKLGLGVSRRRSSRVFFFVLQSAWK